MSDGLSRRSFLKIAGAAGAAAAIPGCEPAARKLIPYVVPDENVIPGVPSFYATTCNECGAGCGVIARVREGRVIKLEGNPKNPINTRSLCARGQAALQGVYNPDRLPHPQVRGEDGRLRTVSWDHAIKLLNGHLMDATKAGEDRIAYFGRSHGPTLDKVTDIWLNAWKSKRAVYYEPLNNWTAREAVKECFGRGDLPLYKLDQAEAIISFGADYLETWESPVELARQYAAFRTPKERRGQLTIGRSIFVGPRMGITAAKSDEWVGVKPGHETAIAMAVLYVVLKQGWISPNSGFDIDTLHNYVAGFDPAAVSSQTGVPAETITRIAQIFGKSDGAVAMAGTEDKQTHIAAFILNAVTGNIGKTVQFVEDQPAPAVSTRDEVDALLKAMHNKQIDVLLIAESNPVYSMPTSADFQGALRHIPFVIWAGGVPDETAARANLLLPLHHPLETWRDTAPRAGIRGLGQPVMVPVFESRELGDLMLSSAHTAGVTAKEAPWENMTDAMNANWQQLAGQLGVKENPKDFWYQSLRDGGVFMEPKPSAVKLDPAVFNARPGAIPSGAGLTFVAYPHMFLDDGRGADKPWLQEIPEPIAQIVWDSWAAIHPDTAKTLGVSRNDVIELSTEQGKAEVSALVTEQVKAGVIAVPLGQGHTAYGRYAVGRGINPFSVLPANSLNTAVKVRRTGRKHKLISPLFSEDMMGRNIVEAMSIEQIASGKAPPKEPLAPEPYEMYTPFKYPTHKWGMTIDVNACTGCSACVAACYAENNLYVVGKEEVDRGRIMSWIRIERYLPHENKAAHAPQMYITPMLCQQCDQAPCEPVCPVFAAYHTQEGLNGQNYNRCVGTRYCENNCPYKVRRFNWVKPEWPAPLNLQLNPDVTVRGAGVMEKCTFCMQRIVYSEINAMVENRKLRDGEILTACQEACPTYAISFGDMNDKNSEMMRRRADNKLRPYYVLEEFNTLPAIVYLRDIYHEKGRA